MGRFLENKLFGLSVYFLAMVSLQQVVIIPILALLLIIAVYKGPSPLTKAHAKYILSVFAGVSLVVLIVANFFGPEERIVAALTAVSIGFGMLAFGAYRMMVRRKPFMQRQPA